MTDDSEWLNLFVPGRLCLFGEHSDWAGSYRHLAETPGYCIAVGTDGGIYARVRKRDGIIVACSHLPHIEPLCIAPDSAELLSIAKAGGFWSYVAGTLHEILQSYPISGLEIKCDRMDLPLKKGLSSSAAVCILVARACNELYKLGLDKRDEMELAYRGETLTPSRCGRMDQICAYGQVPTFLTFDGEDLAIETIPLGGLFYYLIVDLQGNKDTVTILRDLNNQFTNGEGAIGEGIRRALGSLNQQIVYQVRAALISGDARRVGELMVEAQTIFDRLVAPACPSQLQAPKLHQLLEYPPLQELIWGGKGVGSQGDGTAQLLARGPEERLLAQSTIESELGLPCLSLF
ncbi:mevalonate kinase family protein [Aerosakkonema funiforme]|uniref:GHMP kinase n=1 Tax=Aerosakkonema funiforme FACHB-1375 TaxID=2949571 RepID=A0A926VIL4_9CYAN|nr:GHMP kinase [Aerosakkonema funiforme]MBD2183843.1 GHMP kinase [Aerosakkonema funiforme FACHB-1375]